MKPDSRVMRYASVMRLETSDPAAAASLAISLMEEYDGFLFGRLALRAATCLVAVGDLAGARIVANRALGDASTDPVAREGLEAVL